ncbi:deoxyribodipyrimidine photo-lyase [Sphingobacterium corticibacter]|uniref:Deoxyribodipyrimidine photolyase n=1 Tax=Sphingobacterium corticibacter TaxID=2171749 RepID=A0A2T8HM77_9SPHI|nr:deoxyribodipyrimidine photo-lyase [Sphingobacterium corticibacter]PVH26527.1 deoxyribodipyrimidine photolyase [Sphingobacterium corticibacter]
MDKRRVILVWFRNDLRLHDNEILLEAVQKADVVIPVYCFDPRYFSTNKYGGKNTGVLRAQFIRETVQSFKQSLRDLHGDLMTYHGYPEEIIPRLAAKYDADEVYHHREVAQRETKISELVESSLWQSNRINLKHFIGHTMYHKEDLPFPVRDIPDSFALFKKKVERESQVRPTLAEINQILIPTHLEATEIPTLSDLGFTNEEIATVSQKQLIGGEQHGLENLDVILSDSYKGFHDFTLISPYMATGALSPVLVYHRLHAAMTPTNKKRLERRTARLFWRDYYRFMLKKYPNVYFKLHGHQGTPPEQSGKALEYMDWKAGKTGQAFIDQAIHILRSTGNLPSEARIVLALYLLQETNNTWLESASFFEEHLLDYNPATTYGIWSHIAGVGTSKKDNLTGINWQDALAKHYPKGLQYEENTINAKP